MAGAAASAGAGDLAGDGLGEAEKDLNIPGGFGTSVLNGTVSGMVGAGASDLVQNKRFNGYQVADAFGNALGGATASWLSQPTPAATQQQAVPDVLRGNYDAPQQQAQAVPDILRGNYGQAPVSDTGASGDSGSQAKREVTLKPGQGMLQGLADAGVPQPLRRAMYGQILANYDIKCDSAGVPIFQPGVTYEVDLSDLSQASAGGQAIADETSTRDAQAAAMAEADRKLTPTTIGGVSMGDVPAAAAQVARNDAASAEVNAAGDNEPAIRLRRGTTWCHAASILHHESAWTRLNH